MIVVLASVTVRAEHRADFLENARTLIGATVREEGCELYDLMSSITEPNGFVFVERWASREALEAHFQSAHIAEWRRISAPFIEKAEVEVIHPDRVEKL